MRKKCLNNGFLTSLNKTKNLTDNKGFVLNTRYAEFQNQDTFTGMCMGDRSKSIALSKEYRPLFFKTLNPNSGMAEKVVGELIRIKSLNHYMESRPETDSPILRRKYTNHLKNLKPDAPLEKIKTAPEKPQIFEGKMFGVYRDINQAIKSQLLSDSKLLKTILDNRKNKSKIIDQLTEDPLYKKNPFQKIEAKKPKLFKFDRQSIQHYLMSSLTKNERQNLISKLNKQTEKESKETKLALSCQGVQFHSKFIRMTNDNSNARPKSCYRNAKGLKIVVHCNIPYIAPEN